MPGSGIGSRGDTCPGEAGILNLQRKERTSSTPKYRGYSVNRQRTIKVLGAGLAAVALGGCQDWMAEPVRVEQSYGQSVRTAYLDQIYDPARARNPDTYAPDGNIDGIKSIKVLQRGYQADIGQPQRIRQIQGFSLQQGGGGGGGMGGGGQ